MEDRDICESPGIPIQYQNLTGNSCDADEGLNESSGQISLPFPSISRTTLSYHQVTPSRPRLAHPIVRPAVHSPSTPVDPARPSYPQQCYSSPSACSTSSSASVDTNGINWFSASTTLGGLWTSPSTDSLCAAGGPGVDELARAEHTHHSAVASMSPFTFPAEHFPHANGAQPALTATGASMSLLPAWNGGAGTGAPASHHAQAHSHGHDSLGAYALLNAAEAGYVSPGTYATAGASAQHRGALHSTQLPQAQAHGHVYDPSPPMYASLPATPTQPRQSHRFTSLPSLYTAALCESSAISPLALSPQAGSDEWHMVMGLSPVSLSSPINPPSLSSAAWS